MNQIQAINTFWNSFGLTAYDEGTVPDDAVLPYITYSVAEDDFKQPVSLTASLWYKSYKWDEITTKCHEISHYIGLGGIMVRFEGGAIWIQKGSPFAQRIVDQDDSIRRISMNIEAEFIGN